MAKLITHAYLRTECDISQNVDDKSLDNRIKWAQDSLRMLLGTTFYNEIETQYTAKTLTSDNTALFDPYIKQFVAWQAYEYYLTHANYSHTRTGLRKHLDDVSEVISDKYMGEVLAFSKNKTAYYRGEMLSYLKQQQYADQSKYPLYDAGCNTNYGTGGVQISAISKRNKSYSEIERYKRNEY